MSTNHANRWVCDVCGSVSDDEHEPCDCDDATCTEHLATIRRLRAELVAAGRLASVQRARDEARCHDCDLPLATAADHASTHEGEGEHLCWRDYNGGVCILEPVDWRARALAAEQELRCERLGRDAHRADLVAAVARAERAEAEVERLTAALARANDSSEHFERHWYLVQDEVDGWKNTAICVECGRCNVDEDGCCVTCGMDALLFIDGKLINRDWLENHDADVRREARRG